MDGHRAPDRALKTLDNGCAGADTASCVEVRIPPLQLVSVTSLLVNMAGLRVGERTGRLGWLCEGVGDLALGSGLGLLSS